MELNTSMTLGSMGGSEHSSPSSVLGSFDSTRATCVLGSSSSSLSSSLLSSLGYEVQGVLFNLGKSRVVILRHFSSIIPAIWKSMVMVEGWVKAPMHSPLAASMIELSMTCSSSNFIPTAMA